MQLHRGTFPHRDGRVMTTRYRISCPSRKQRMLNLWKYRICIAREGLGCKKILFQVYSREDIRCDVNESLWPNAEERIDLRCGISLSVAILYMYYMYGEYV